ncbi:antibiotic biosynthesis monooxygenase [Pseudoalteromonas sp. SWYJZ19]|uniref:antibiotic biosynthesis monooxygenase n=2 Tax=unclassified Pseudoalteromonas TaxID=194690 RepID=UPI0018CE4253|nr:antibiotic biosynthesis monooxygenase [Pseudoalteromonas sp. SWYJZ19]MBH0050862.1 antibiotic biosynthesis monooxygenase [Pseudoalteromonas sp. SWYJZ19]
MKRIIAFLIITLLCSQILTGCDSINLLVDDMPTVQSNDFSLTKKWETSGFKMPESVFASSEHPWLYVSNVNGANPGFISRVAKDGTIDNLKWATGFMAPTGSDLYQNKLYVADVKQLHAIDLTTGKITQSFTADDALSLNDVSIDQKTGDVYISDVPGGKVYRLKNNKLSLWFESPKIPYPNGILVQGNTLIVANYAVKNGKGLMRQKWGADDLGTLYKIDMATKALTAIPSSAKKGGYDGVIEFNGVLMASSNPTGQILTFDNNQSFLIDATDKGVADINTDGETIYAPYLFNNKLTAYSAVPWDRVTTKNEYLEKGADNYYGDADGMSIATHDGIIKGLFAGVQLTGTWDWKGEYFCRTSILGTMDLGSDCIQIDVTDNKMRLTLEKGTGMSVVYDKKPKNDEITILSTFKIKPEKIELYKKEMLGNQDVVRKEGGTLEMKLFQDKNTTGNFFVFGRNAGAASLESHSENVEDRGIAERVESALVEAPKTLFLINQAPLLTQDVEVYNVEEDDVLLFFIFDVKETHRDALLEQLRIHTKLTRQEEGNIRFDFYRLKGSENTIVLQQQWQNDAAGAFHREQDYTKKTDEMMTQAIGDLKQLEFFVNQVETINADAQAINSKTNSDKEENTRIQMVGRFQMQEEGRAKFKAAMLDVVKGTVNEPGALGIRMFEDVNNPGLVFGQERFKDFSAVEYHRKQPYELALIEVAGTALSAAPVAFVFGPAVVEEVRAADERKVDPSELYVVAIFDIKPDQFDRVIEQYKKQIPNVREHEGSISFNAFTVLDTPNQLVVIEWWKSAEVARAFSTTDPLSIETGKVLTESLERPIPEYLHELREVNP